MFKRTTLILVAALIVGLTSALAFAEIPTDKQSTVQVEQVGEVTLTNSIDVAVEAVSAEVLAHTESRQSYQGGDLSLVLATATYPYEVGWRSSF